MSDTTHPDLDAYRDIENRLAPIMFGLAILFLIALAALIVARVDIPRVVELNAIDALATTPTLAHSSLLALSDETGRKLLSFLLLLWPVFIAESVFHLLKARSAGATRRNVLLRVAAAVIPPLRLGATSAAWEGRSWLPALGWVQPGKASSSRLQRFFGKPMIAIALLILPILMLEFGLKSLVTEHFWLQMLIHVATGFIWFAFTLEFILMLSVTDKKLRYIKTNWIDLAIILLPLISFLRGIRALRLAKLAKVQQLAKMGRVYRMRGLGMKLLRALMLFEAVNRLLRITPEKQLARLEALREQHLEELAELDDDIASLRQVANDWNTRADQPQTTIGI